MSGLYQNCRNLSSSWSKPVCAIGNISGYCSAALWFMVLVPQVIKNFRLRSVVGLSFLWAAANFTASLINLFFVFTNSLPFYVKVEGIYQPCLEFTILFQFFVFSKTRVDRRLLALLVCLLVWSAIIMIQLTVDGAANNMFWGAVVLWSVETFPQVILNMKRRSTSGQSTVSVGIALTGKVTDFVGTYSLSMPLPFVIMAYFSSSSAYVNGFQVFWYGIKKAKRQNTNSSKEIKKLLSYLCPRFISTETKRTHEQENLMDNETINPTELNNEVSTDDENTNDCGNSEPQEEATLPLTRWRLVGLLYCSLILVAFTIGLVWNIGAWWAAWGPVLVLLVLIVAYLHRSYKEGKLRCLFIRN